MDKDRFISLVSEPDHPIHAATDYMASLENRKPEKAIGWMRTVGFIATLMAIAFAIFATS
jgi:hypothetical protein